MGETKERRAQTDAQSTQTNTRSFNCTHQHSHRPSPSETIYEKDIYPTPSYLADIPKSSSMLACQSIMKNSPHCSPGRCYSGSPPGHRFRCIGNIWREGWRLQKGWGGLLLCSCSATKDSFMAIVVGHVEMPQAMKQTAGGDHILEKQ